MSWIYRCLQRLERTCQIYRQVALYSDPVPHSVFVQRRVHALGHELFSTSESHQNAWWWCFQKRFFDFCWFLHSCGQMAWIAEAQRLGWVSNDHFVLLNWCIFWFGFEFVKWVSLLLCLLACLLRSKRARIAGLVGFPMFAPSTLSRSVQHQ